MVSVVQYNIAEPTETSALLGEGTTLLKDSEAEEAETGHLV